MKKILLNPLFFFCLNFSYAQSGQLDRSFGTSGIAKTDMGAHFDYNSSARQVLPGVNGSMLLILNEAIISKRLPNGSVDSLYGVNGYSGAILLNDAYGALQADGKIAIAGSKDNGATFIVARINTNGTPDSSFGNNGIQITPLNPRCVGIQSDGKIVVAGSINDIFGVVRYNLDGSPDNAFNGNGQVTTEFGINILQFATTLFIQADGKIVAGGYINTDVASAFAIARYNLDGSLDNTFDIDGKQTTNIGSTSAMGYSLAIQNDGKIILAGNSSDGITSQFAIVRYNIDGSLDNSFNGNGIQTANLGSDMQIGNTVGIQSNGKIVVAGYILNGSLNDFAIARFNIDGSPDNELDSDGILTTDLGSSDDYAVSLAIQSDDKIVVSGYANSASGSGFALTRYSADGSLDNSFDTDGKLAGGYKQGYTNFNFTAVQANGKILAAGHTWNGVDYDFALARFNSNGAPDNTFSGDGKLVTDFGATDEAISVLTQPDGKIILAGNTDSKFAISRYNPDGSPDNTFSGDGNLTITIGFADVCKSVALQTDGKIVMAGYTFTDSNYDSAHFAIARLNSDGTTDNTFSGDGELLTDFDGSSSFGSSVAIQPDGKIVVAGRSYINSQNNFSLARYNTDGSLDNSFSQDGKQNNAFGPDGYIAESLAIQKDGKIILAGQAEEFSGSSSSFAIARYKTDGELDNTFGDQGFQSTYLGPHFNFGMSVAVNTDGKIAVGGTNDNYAIVLYKNNGTRDSTFGNNGILTTHIGMGASSIQHIIFSNNNLYATGSGQFPGTLGVVARYLLAEGGPLAVTLMDFKAVVLQNKTVLLQWQTASQQDLSGFDIQRSADGNNFSSIGYTNATGNSNVKINYSTIDRQPLQGINFYRLKMVDIDGSFSYSKIIKVTLNGEIFTWKVFPNPAQNVLFINARGENEKATFRIIDAGGRKLKEIKVSLNENTFFPVYINNLPKGVYNLQLNTKTKNETRRFIKE